MSSFPARKKKQTKRSSTPKIKSAKSSSKKTSGKNSFILSFDDNHLFSLLCGPHDNHLAIVEEFLGIEISPRGNRLALSGDFEECQTAKQSLEDIYQRLVEGRDIDKGDVKGAVRFFQEERKSESDNMSSGPTIKTPRRVISPRSATQGKYIEALKKAQLVFGTGPAGTGKTYLAVAMGCAALSSGEVDRIILSRPAVEAGERLGFLPGDMKEKVDPYLRPLYDALYDMLPAEKVVKGLENGMIEIAPLAFMRGRTLTNAYVILDEAQNTTSMQMKMFLTRLGENSRMVVTGDMSQIDLPRGEKSGLVEAVTLLKNVKEIEKIQFNHKDVVRHPLVAKIARAYDAITKKDAARRNKDT